MYPNLEDKEILKTVPSQVLSDKFGLEKEKSSNVNEKKQIQELFQARTLTIPTKASLILFTSKLEIIYRFIKFIC